MNIQQALVASPPTPACFGDRLQWAAYLQSCQEFGKRESDRPFTDDGVFRPAWNFCTDCLSGHAKAMAHAKRCKPSQFRVLVIAKETA